MTEIISSFLHFTFVGLVALFPPINPIGTAFMIDPFFKGADEKSRRSASLKVAIYSGTICIGTLIVGSWVFKLFGISLPVVQVAGGIMICRMGWQFLSADDQLNRKGSETTNTSSSLDKYLFYPMAFPMTTGAGTISVLLTLSAHGHASNLESYLMNLSALAVSALIMMIIVYVSYCYTPLLLKKIGPNGEQIVNRLSSFLVFCVGLQIAIDGMRNLGLLH